MSLYIANNLNSRLLAKNHSALVLRKEGFYTAGAPAEYILACNDTFVDGETIELEFGANVVELNITDPPYILPTDMPIFTLHESNTAGLWAAALRKIPLLDELFYIERVATTDNTKGFVRLLAKNPGVAYNLTWGAGSSISSTLTQITAGVDPVQLADYKVNLEVQALIDGRWQNVYEATADPLPDLDSNSAEIAFYDVAPVIRPYLYFEPITDIYAVKIDTGIFSKVRVFYWESYGGNDYHKTAISSSDLTVLLMSLNISHSEAHKRFEDYHYASNTHKFLTNHSRTKYITRNQPEFLSIYCREAVDRIYVVAYFSDGTSTNATYNTGSLAFIGNPVGKVVRIPSGFVNLGLSALETGAPKVVKYDVIIRNSTSNNRSETFTYVIDYRYFPNENYFFFYNSLGGIDTLRYKGYDVEQVEVSFDEVAVAADSSTRLSGGMFSQRAKSIRERNVFQAGWNEANEQAFLADFMMAEDVYKLNAIASRSSNTQRITLTEKVIVNNKKLELIDSLEFIYNAEFEVSSATENTGLASAVADADAFETPDEFVVEVSNPNDEGYVLRFNCLSTGFNQRLFANGVLFSAGNDSQTINYTVPAHTTIKFVLKARFLNAIMFQDVTTGVLKIKALSIPTHKVITLRFNGFDNVSSNWFVNRVRNFDYTSTLEVQGLATAAEVDMILHEAAANKAAGGPLVQLMLQGSNPAPSTYGLQAKAWLNASGVSALTN